MIGGWARKEGIVIERAEANVVGPPTSNYVCALVVVKNIGSSPFTPTTAQANGPAGPITLTPTAPGSIQPGQTASFTGCGTAGTRGDMISVYIAGTIPGGSVGDRRSVPIT
jgi:hypothetical protein